jgi:hypothetical protein
MTFTFKEIKQGCDVIDWARHVVLPRVKRTAGNTRYIFPDPLEHLREFARAHSWYKHLRDRPVKFYPIIRYGVVSDPDILSYKRKREEDLKSLYWSFVTEESLYEGEWRSGSKVLDWPIAIFKNHSFHAGAMLSCFSLASSNEEALQTSTFLAQCVLTECEKLCDIIVRVLLSIDPNPPTAQMLLFQSSIDTYEDDDNEGLCISNRFYKWTFGAEISWSLDERHNAAANSNMYKDDAVISEENSNALSEVQQPNKESKTQ